MSASEATVCVEPDAANKPDGLVVLSTTRHGGVSRPPFHSMNLGLHVDDDEHAVRRNRRHVAERFNLPAEPVWLHQTHSTKVEVVNKAQKSTVEADGSYTCTAGTVLAVLTADCLPVVIMSSDGSQLALLHAGWRGLAHGIIGNAVSHFDSDTTLQAWFGPAIGAGQFEVGEDVLDAFTHLHADNARHFVGGHSSGKYLADLYALARAELQRHGCEQVSGGDYCTYSQPELFHSYRRDGARSGRMATLAWIR